MNKTRIDYADYTWNPITGCRHGCEFCYARKLQRRYGLYGGSFEPQFHPRLLDEPRRLKEPNTIFVCDMGDIFSPGVRADWLDRVKAAADAAPWHTYLWLTKNPNGRASYDNTWVRPNWWLGATITGPDDAWKRDVCVGGNVWYSYEPLLGLPDESYAYDADQVIIGAATRAGLPYSVSWAKELIRRYEGAKVLVKRNGYWPGAPRDVAWPLNKSTELTAQRGKEGE